MRATFGTFLLLTLTLLTLPAFAGDEGLIRAGRTGRLQVAERPSDCDDSSPSDYDEESAPVVLRAKPMHRTISSAATSKVVRRERTDRSEIAALRREVRAAAADAVTARREARQASSAANKAANTAGEALREGRTDRLWLKKLIHVDPKNPKKRLGFIPDLQTTVDELTNAVNDHDVRVQDLEASHGRAWKWLWAAFVIAIVALLLGILLAIAFRSGP